MGYKNRLDVRVRKGKNICYIRELLTIWVTAVEDHDHVMAGQNYIV